MRILIGIAALLALGLTPEPICASSPDGPAQAQQNLAALEAKASQAQPREQCYLYAQLVHQLTEMSMQQHATGNTEAANELLKHIQLAAKQIHLSLADNDKRLKNAELLLNNTVFRLTEMLHASDYDDRPLVEATLEQVRQAQNEAMLQVFQK